MRLELQKRLTRLLEKLALSNKDDKEFGLMKQHQDKLATH
jgi:hypothetical protein